MQRKIVQLITFYLLVFISLTASIHSIKFFPYLSEAQQLEYFNLAYSLILLLVPMAFLTSIFRGAK